MKRIIGIAVLLSLFFIACQSSDDDDDNDTPEEDLHGNGWPEEGLPACPPYQEYEPWFTIENFEDAAWSYRELYGEDFATANIIINDTSIVFQFADMQLTTVWNVDLFDSVFTDNQSVLVYIGWQDMGFDFGPRNLWVLSDEAELLVYHDQNFNTGTYNVGAHQVDMQFEYMCEYYDLSPPTLYDNEWALVFGRELSGDIDGLHFSVDQTGQVVDLTAEGYRLYVPVNYIGQYKGIDEGDSIDGPTSVEDFVLQIIKSI